MFAGDSKGNTVSVASPHGTVTVTGIVAPKPTNCRNSFLQSARSSASLPSGVRVRNGRTKPPRHFRYILLPLICL